MIVRGIVSVPFGRRGQTGPTSTTVGGPWPFVRCESCGEWIDPKTGEHAESMTLEEALAEVKGGV